MENIVLIKIIKRKINILLVVIVLLLIFSISCTTNIKTPADSYVECVNDGMKNFRFKSGSQWGAEVRMEFTKSFKEYSDKILKNCMIIYNKEGINEN